MTGPGGPGGAAPGPLAGTIRRGAALSTAGLAVTQVVALAQTLVVARLLGPAVVGSFAAGIVLIGVLQLVGTGGLRQALVQRPEEGLEPAANTALWATNATGVLTALGAFAASPLLAELFSDPLAGTVAAATAGVQVLHALGQVPDALLQRRFQFRRRIVVDPAMVLGHAAVSITLCTLGFGVWGPVLGLYAHELAFVVTAWWLAGWRPGRARPSVTTWREMGRFSSPLVVGGLIERGQQALEGVLLGRLLGTTALGLYRYGRRLGEVPGRVVIEVGAYVLFPAFARIADDAVRFRRGYLRALRALWTAAVPLAGLLVSVGGPAIVVLLGDGWRGAAPAVVTMAGWAPGLALSSVSVEALKGTGRSREVLALTGAGFVVGIGLLLVLAPVWGLGGAGLSLSVGSLFVGVLALAAVRRVVGTGVRELVTVLVPPVVAGVVATAVTAVGEHELLRADTRALLPALGALALDVLVFAVTYLALLWTLTRRSR